MLQTRKSVQTRTSSGIFKNHLQLDTCWLSRPSFISYGCFKKKKKVFLFLSVLLSLVWSGRAKMKDYVTYLCEPIRVQVYFNHNQMTVVGQLSYVSTVHHIWSNNTHTIKHVWDFLELNLQNNTFFCELKTNHTAIDLVFRGFRYK